MDRSTDLDIKQPSRLISDVLVWFGGIKPRLLRQTPTERMKYSALGFAVLLTSGLGAVMATLVAGYLLHKAPTAVWPVGAGFFVILSNIERLLIMLSRSGGWLAASIPLRLIIAIPIGILVAEVFLLQVFQPEENAVLGTQHRATVASQIHIVDAFYAPRLRHDARVESMSRHTLRKLADRVEHYRFLGSCEASNPKCSVTHRKGCGVFCKHDQRRAATVRRELRSQRPVLTRSITRSEADAAHLRRQRARAEHQVRMQTAADDGLGAHRRALGEVERRDGLTWLVWLLRLTFIGLDLTPILVKSLFLLQGTGPYDDLVSAVQGQERVAAYGHQVNNELDKYRIDVWAQARRDVIDAEVDNWRSWRLWDIGRGPRNDEPNGFSPNTEYAAWEEPVSSISTPEYSSRAAPHERMAMAMPAAVRRLAFVSALITVASSTVLYLLISSGHVSVRDWWLVPVASLLIGVAGAASRGFRRAPVWTQRAAFGTTLFGLTVTPMVIGLNLI